MEHEIIRVRRQTPKRVEATGHLRCGAAAVDITPHLGLPMAGYSSSGLHASSLRGRLYARALLIEDGRGERVALCHLDMMCASRYLLERAAAYAAPVSGIGIRRLILTGTHTHTGPGLFYGNRLYDAFASARAGFDQGLSDWICRRIAEAIKKAQDNLVPARIGTASVPLWGTSRNASLAAFWANPEAEQWEQPGFPGHGAPEGLTDRQRAVDPRLQVLAAVDAEGSVIAATAAFGLHCTSQGSGCDGYDPDWAGIAVQEAEHLLQQNGHSNAMVAVAISAAGDVNSLTGNTPQGPIRARQVGRTIGQTIADCIGQAVVTAKDDLQVDVRYTEVSWTEPESLRTTQSDAHLAKEWSFGIPVLAGGDDGRTWLYRAGLVSTGVTGNFYPSDHPQHPKQPAFGKLQRWYAQRKSLAPSRVWPMHTVKIGQHLMATLPGEPTTITAWRLEQALLEHTKGVTSARVLGYAGDYGGYLTTPEEYQLQHYEGASTLMGRHSSTYLRECLVGLASGQRKALIPRGEAMFLVGPVVNMFPGKASGPTAAPKEIQTMREGASIKLMWTLRRGALVSFSEGAMVHVEADVQKRWEPVVIDGKAINDITWPMVIARQKTLSGPDRWSVTFELPEDLKEVRRLRVRVARLGRFAGFISKLPDP